MIKPFHIKNLLAWIFELSGLNWILHYFQVKLFSPYIRAVYYHDVSPFQAGRFEQHLRYYAKHYSPVSYQDLLLFHEGRWNKSKPGLIITFDDGFRSFHEVIAPLLEKYGFVGWFFIPSGLIDMQEDEQLQKAIERDIFTNETGKNNRRIFLTWDQVIDLDKNHVVGCHTLSHCRLSSTLSESRLQDEIVKSKMLLEEKLNHEVPVFAWVGGEEESYSHEAAAILNNAYYKAVFLTNSSLIKPATDLFLLDRSHIEVGFSLALLRFQLSGFMDIYYASKRKRVNRLVGG